MGKQILPDYWVNYTTSPAIHSKNQYGAHFWLNKEHSFYKDAPEDMFYADGYQGQYVFIIPSRDLVVVRMGTGDKNFDVNSFLKVFWKTWEIKTLVFQKYLMNKNYYFFSSITNIF